MLSIRLSRVGRKNAPSYRIVVMPKHQDPYGKAVEIVGHYNPRSTPVELELNAERIKHWISQGAEVTNSVWNILVEEKIVEGKKRSVTHISNKRKTKMDEKNQAAKDKQAEAEKTKQEPTKEEPKPEEKPAEEPPKEPEAPESNQAEPTEPEPEKIEGAQAKTDTEKQSE